MNTKYLILLSFIASFYSNDSFSQVCLHTDLSKKYNYELTYTINKNVGISDLYDISKIKINIIGKLDNKILQSITVTIEDRVFRDSFQCMIHSFVRSYITGTNKNEDSSDKDYGDFIVTDFNFDGKEDFAVKVLQGNNGGPRYKFFIASATGLFKEDLFFSEEIVNFPSINYSAKTMKLVGAIGCCRGYKTIYKFNNQTKRWIKVSSKIYDF